MFNINPQVTVMQEISPAKPETVSPPSTNF
jgi:hypothetical protein